MIVGTRDLFKAAYGSYALGAYNIHNAEQALGVFKGCAQSRAPFLLQFTKGARRYTHPKMIEAIVRGAQSIFPDCVLAVHLDHGDEATCHECIESGFYTSVMIDASSEPFEKNVEITKRVVAAAHLRGVCVEAELGCLGAVDPAGSHHGTPFLTSPRAASEFVGRTGCDSLAVAMGNSHGVYKFKGKQSLHYEVLEEIQALLPGFPLVLHGASSVSLGEVQRIHAAGGDLTGAAGVDDGEYLRAARHGVTKVNIDTDSKLLWMRVHREFLRDHPGEFDFRLAGSVYMKELAEMVIRKNHALGCAHALDRLPGGTLTASPDGL